MDITISQKIAIIDEKNSYSYQFLFEKSFSIAHDLKQKYNNLKGERIAFLATQNVDYILIQWAIWQVEAIAVPLSIAYTDAEWSYILEDTKAFLVINNITFNERLQNICLQKQVHYYQIQDIDINSFGFINVPQKLIFNLPQKALIIYTSGTTGKPKGVVTTHQIIENQINTLIEAWQWNQNDYSLLVLPLHHIHGVINILGCALQVGATLKILPKFDAQAVWECFENEDFSVFMAVPTIYHKLLQTYQTFSLEKQEKLTQKLKKMRLMVSGSAALPIVLLEKWKNISGHILLERYGMTEIGMAISNPYQNTRKAGKVGLPLPKVKVKLLNDKDEIITQPHQAGEIYIKSPSVFLEYWNKPKETQESFKEGWFSTGDTAEFDEDGYFKILGRTSIDIIKTGGYKVSALEIENILRENQNIVDCAVAGIKDEEWGEKIAVFFMAKQEQNIEDLKKWAKTLLAPYKVPTIWKEVKELPKNVMGKVLKNELKY